MNLQFGGHADRAAEGLGGAGGGGRGVAAGAQVGEQQPPGPGLGRALPGLLWGQVDRGDALGRLADQADLFVCEAAWSARRPRASHGPESAE